MRYVHSLTLLACLLAVFGATSALAADSQPFGVIDSQRIVEEYDAARDARQQMEKFVRDMEKEISDKQRELQRLQEDFDSQQMLLGEAARSQRMQELEQAKAEYFRFREQVEQRVQQEYDDKIGEIINQVKTIAERIGKEEGFGIIIDSAAFTVLYIDDNVDLTNKVLEALARGEED
jgi:outer membrane protein